MVAEVRKHSGESRKACGLAIFYHRTARAVPLLFACGAPFIHSNSRSTEKSPDLIHEKTAARIQSPTAVFFIQQAAKSWQTSAKR